ncbi:MAG: hypothetical protein WD025_02955 [Bacteriovoracaceae bacterium]
MENNRSNLAGKKVVVGMTGRMDSAMAAFLLKKQGMDVIGLSIVTTNDAIVDKKELLPLCHIQDLEKVRELCERIGAPFYATNAKPQFESEVIDRIVCNKLLGKANSSCFDCAQLRMWILFDKMQTLKADYIATGHYAKVHQNLVSKEFFIHSNNDENSDQSFLLAGTHPSIIEKLILPLGDLNKKEVAKYAKHFSLPAAPSMEQKGFCFRTKESSTSILKSRVPKSLIRPGPVENLDSGNTQGEHEGVVFHYLTEKELDFKSSAHVDKNLEIVGYNYSKAAVYIGHGKHLSFKGAQLSRMALSAGLDKTAPINCFVKFKYSNMFVKADLFFKNNDSAFLQFSEKIYPLIPEEVLVIYDSDSSNSKVIGWGLVGARGDFKLVNRVERFERAEENESTEAQKPDYFKF